MAENVLNIDYGCLAPKTEIRILTLEKGSGDDPIVCTLHRVTHGEEDYEALSYEWGDKGDDDPSIMVEKRQVQVRRNLYEALREIREPSKDLSLWVDAICINQANIEEKGHQVAKMGDIFAKAVGVIAWLGPARDDSDLAMNWLQERRAFHRRRSLETDDRNWRLGRMVVPGGDVARVVEAISSLVERSYWRRVWIIQELYLAQSTLIRCGSKSVPGDVFDLPLTSDLESGGSPRDQDLWKGLQDTFLESPANHHYRAKLLKKAADAKFNKLRRWLAVCITCNFQCTREHDIIYALLGVASDCQNGSGGIQVDYAKEPRELFLEVLRLNLFSWMQPDTGSQPSVKRWEELAEKMNLELDDSLKNSMCEISKHLTVVR